MLISWYVCGIFFINRPVSDVTGNTGTGLQLPTVREYIIPHSQRWKTNHQIGVSPLIFVQSIFGIPSVILLFLNIFNKKTTVSLLFPMDQNTKTDSQMLSVNVTNSLQRKASQNGHTTVKSVSGSSTMIMANLSVSNRFNCLLHYIANNSVYEQTTFVLLWAMGLPLAIPDVRLLTAQSHLLISGIDTALDICTLKGTVL